MSQPPDTSQGVIGWMVKNKTTPNLMMIALILGGLWTSTRIKQEVFPEFDLDRIVIQVAYPGAGPEEVEQGIILALEEAVQGIDGIDRINATAGEGGGGLDLELFEGADADQVHQEVKQAVDRIRTFPEDAEEPEVSQVVRRRSVLTLQLYGDTDEAALREIVERVRDGLLADGRISQVDVVGARGVQVHVEIPGAVLRGYGLTLQEVAARISAASVDLPGGRVETGAGEILLRVKDRRLWASEFVDIPILTTPSGSVVRLGDVATVREGFEETNRAGFYNDHRCIGLEVYRVGDQTPIGVSEAVYEVMEALEADLPRGIGWSINDDRSESYRQRLELLLKNALLGLILVMVVLGLFLELRVAFWVTMGIPTSFLGGLIFLDAMDVSINMISMFAFIVSLGIVVDDAIIAGENIYERRVRGESFGRAAVKGAREVAVPIAFSILSNIVTFLPLYFVPGVAGKIWKVIPVVVTTVFLLSWVESLLILPAHLAHGGSEGPPGPVARFQAAFARGVARFSEGVYGPALAWCIRWRLVVVALGVATVIGCVGYIMGGRIGMIFLPRVESDSAAVTAVLPFGSPDAQVEAVRARLTAAIDEVARANGGAELVTGVFSEVNENQVVISAYLTPPEVRPMSTTDVSLAWRQATGPIPGLQSLRFQSDRGGPGSGSAISVELSHRNIETLDKASQALAEALAEFPNVKDIDDGYAAGKPQLDFRLKPAGASLGLTSREIARQVRAAFFGAEAVRQQRRRDEVRVLVRLPEPERASEVDVGNLWITAPGGQVVALRDATEIIQGRSYTSINRRDGRRTVTVTADVEPIEHADRVLEALRATTLPNLQRDFPGLSYGFEGRQADRQESLGALGNGFLMALVVIYFLLAVPFRSYVQPLVIMAAIPFGIIGAVLGHVVMGYALSVISMMGIVALAGVVVNDALVLTEYANRRRAEGLLAEQAALEAGVRRFRPVILTTLTTFGGLAPMIFETSRQARFLIPMALSLGFGILFATAITLVLVPCLYVYIDHLETLPQRLMAWSGRPRPPEDDEKDE